MMENNVKVRIEIPFPSASLATVAYNVLMVDDEPSRSQVTKELVLMDSILKIEFEAPKAKQVRVATTSFFENLKLVVDTINFAGLPKHSKYSYL